MIKKYAKQLIVSSVVILLPILIGLILWNTLPDQFATHWSFSGEADGWSGKAFAVFAPPLSMLAAHWFCFWIATLDPRAKAQNKKVFGIIFRIFPILSLATSGMIFALALGTEFHVTSVLLPGIAITLIGIGNFLPKCRQNYVIGIRVSWALANEENWNATHRFAGKVWVTGGLALLFLAFLPAKMIIVPMILIILVAGFVPVLFSWAYYKKQCKAGSGYDPKPAPMDKTTRAIMKGAMIFVAMILILVAILLFTGKIDCIYGEDSFTIAASFWNDLNVEYDEITNIELRDGNIDGTRLGGIGSFRLLLGIFENDEFGYYTRYTYYRPEACIVLTVNGKTLVISGRDAGETQEIYNELTQRLEG